MRASALAACSVPTSAAKESIMRWRTSTRSASVMSHRNLWPYTPHGAVAGVGDDERPVGRGGQAERHRERGRVARAVGERGPAVAGDGAHLARALRRARGDGADPAAGHVGDVELA